MSLTKLQSNLMFLYAKLLSVTVEYNMLNHNPLKNLYKHIYEHFYVIKIKNY